MLNRELQKIIDTLNLSELKDSFKNKIAGKKLAIFGAGEAGRKLINVLVKKKIDIDAVISSDNKQWNKKIEDFIVSSPDILSKDEWFVIIASLFWKEIESKLIKRGINNFCSHYFQDLVSTKFDEIIKASEKILELIEIMADIKSIEVLRELLSVLIYEDVFSLSNYFTEQQYLPDDIPELTNALQKIDGDIVDAGAWDGDTLELFINNPITSTKNQIIWSFEPGPTAFDKLCQRIKVNKWEDKCRAIRACLGKEKTELYFDDSCQKGSSMYYPYKQGIKTDVIALDEFLSDRKIGFIKMDIEGAEMDALRGARKLITKNKPILAICVYHNLKDLWEIPLYIHSLLPHHKIFLRHHCFFSYIESVCYAIPSST